MDGSDDRRGFSRFDVGAGEGGAVTIEVPELSDKPIDMVNFGAGGFRMVLPTPPETGKRVKCSLEVSDIRLDGFKAEVIWAKPVSGADPPQWEVGLSVVMTTDERDHFASVLTALLSELKTLE